MEKEILLRFPFSIEDASQESSIKTKIERKENVVSFSLPFDLNVTIKNGSLKLKKAYKSNFIYVFSFCNLNDAEDFLDNTIVDVLHDEEIDCDKLEEEMNRFMIEYENSEKKRDKRVRIYDEDGFYEYK